MERHDILEMMGTLKLVGMRHAYDEPMADAVKRQHSAQRVVGDLLTAGFAPIGPLGGFCGEIERERYIPSREGA